MLDLIYSSTKDMVLIDHQTAGSSFSMPCYLVASYTWKHSERTPYLLSRLLPTKYCPGRGPQVGAYLGIEGRSALRRTWLNNVVKCLVNQSFLGSLCCRRLYPPSLARQRSKTSLWPVLVTGAPTATRDWKTNSGYCKKISSTIVDRAFCVG